MFGLSFLSPLFLIGALAAAIPIALHLFHRKTEPVVEFSAMRFLRHAPVEQSHRRRLRELLLLALRVAALLLLAVAFARPFLTESAAALATPATLVLVDTSVSMTAPGQFESARERAIEIIRAATPGSRVGVMAFADGVREVAPLSANRDAALTAVSRMQPGAGATRYRAALGRAAEQLGDRAGRIVVVTDLQQNGWDAADRGDVPDRVRVEVADVGGPDGNVAVSGLRLDGRDAVAFVQNFGNGAVDEQVRFTLDDRPIGAVAASLPPSGSAEARFTLPEGATGTLAAAVTDRQGYAADNVRYALVDAAAAPLVLVVTASGHPSESFYLERALGVVDGPDGFRVRTISGPAFSKLESKDVSDVRVLAMLGTRGIEQHGRDLLARFVRDGGGLFVAAGADVDASIVRQALSTAAETTWRPRDASHAGDPLRFAPDDSRHPVFRVFGGVGTLDNVSFRRTTLVEPGSAAVVVARYTDGSPALVEDSVGDGRMLIFASDVNDAWNDLPLQPSFVPFMHEAMKHLSSARPTLSEYVVGGLAGEKGISPGVVDVGTEGARRRVVVNVDPRESDPARMTVDAFNASVAALSVPAAAETNDGSPAGEDRQRLWQYALLLMVVSLVAEGLLGRRVGA